MYAQRYLAKKPEAWTETHAQALLDKRALWNDLVEIYRQTRLRERDLYCAADPEVGPQYAAVDELEVALDSAPRGTDPEREAWREILAQLKTARSGLWDRVRALKPNPEIREQLRVLWKDAQRQTYTIAAGKARKYPSLHWADCNDVHDRLWKAIRARKHPRPHDRVDRESLYRQLQSQTKGGVKVEVPGRKRRKIEGGVLVGATWENLQAEHGRGGVKILSHPRRDWMILELADCGLRLPFCAHRHPPKEALIKGVRIVRERVSGHRRYEWYVVLSVDAQPPNPVIRNGNEGRILYAGLGWRQTPQGLRVLAGIDDMGRPWHVTLPQEYVLQWRYSCELEAQLRLSRNIYAEAIGVDPRHTRELHERASESLEGSTWARGTHPGALVHRALLEQGYTPEAAAEILGESAGRRRVGGLRSKILRRRTDLYRRVARAIVRSSSRIVLGTLDGAEIQERSKELPLPARHLRTVAAPASLRTEIEWQARKAGVEVIALDASDASRFCAVHPEVDLYAGRDESRLWLACERCGDALDRDDNYARNLMRRDSPERFERCDWQALTGERSRIKILNITEQVESLPSGQGVQNSRWKYKARLALAKSRRR